MKLRKLLSALVAATLTLQAQEKGAWRPLSNTARTITGDLVFSDTKLTINFSSFPLAQIRTLQPAEARALFNLPEASPAGPGNLFRTSIAPAKRFLHGNTLCGSEETQWVLTSVTGRTLQLALFSGTAIPNLTPEALANTTTLCGTYSYTR